MTEIAPLIGLLDVHTGELLPATVENAGRVLTSARAMKEQVNAIVTETTGWLAEESARQGTRTLQGGGETITISGGDTVEYDAHDLVEALRLADCPEDRIERAVVAEITYKVDRSVLRQLAGANPAYRIAIELAERHVEKPFRASVKLRRHADE